MSRKAAERNAKKKFILSAARKLYAEKGIEDTSMEDIAEASEYTRRTLYSYFLSRDEITLAILIEDLNARWKEQKDAIGSVESGLDKIVAWAEALNHFTERYPHSIRLQVYWDYRGINRRTISAETFAEFESINNELAEGLRAIFNLGIADGSLRDDLPIDLAISHFLYTYRSILNKAYFPTYSFARFGTEEYIEYYLRAFVDGIRYKRSE